MIRHVSIALAGLLACGAGCAPEPQPPPYTGDIDSPDTSAIDEPGQWAIAVMPDTQKYTTRHTYMLAAQTAWIAERANRGEIALRFDSVSFTDLMRWLDAEDPGWGYEIAQFRVERTDRPAMVAARLTLVPPE